jgi:hypothetical protein
MLTSSPVAQLKNSEMADCRFCGKSAGFLRHQHAECRRIHDEATAKIPTLFIRALHDPMPADRFRSLVDQSTGRSFIATSERDQLVRQGLGAAVHAALGNGGLASADDERLGELQTAFSLSLADLGSEGTALAKARILRALDAGKAPSINIELNGPLAPRLENGERVVWPFNNVTYLTMRSRTQYVGRSSGVSIRVMRGVYYRTGAFQGEPIRTDYFSSEDLGSLTIADKNVYFVGTHRALKIPFKKLASAQLYSDGIEILQNGVTAKPLIFKVDDPPFAANLIARLPLD